MSKAPDTASRDITQLLGPAAVPGRLQGRKRWLIAGALVLLAALAGLLLRSGGNGQGPRYQTEPVTRGRLVVTVSATGNLQPTNQVDVGSELSGLIEIVLVDDNDPVKKGQVLARLDTTKLSDQIAKSRAALASAEARVLQAAATAREAKANLARLRQVAALSGGKVPSQAELETGEATFARAEADEVGARAAVAEARAALSADETNLAKASIRSPIDGVVLSRQVEPGQTVAASLQAPVLFTLAEDLTQMELQVDVDEADVGQVRTGQTAAFTVDAWPGRRFPARITRVGLGSQTKDGVVSYLTVLKVANDDLSLRPGMTATAEITTVTREDALLVPNAALRFAPPAAAPAAKQNGGLVASLLPRPPSQPASRPAKSANGEQRVWLLQEGQPVAVAVKTGPSNGQLTEVTGGELAPGMAVITESLGTQQ